VFELDPPDADVIWELDDAHTPRPLTALGTDYMRAIMWGLARFARGTPFRYEYRILNGYAYYARRTDATPETAAEAERAQEERMREAARTLRERWDSKLLPELDEMVSFMRELPVEDLELDALRAAWDEAWNLARRAWEIHFEVVYPAHVPLADLEKVVVGRLAKKPVGGSAGLIGPVSSSVGSANGDLQRLAKAWRTKSWDDELARFLELHGHLGPVDDDLSSPSWREDATTLIELARKRTKSAGRRVGRSPDTKAAVAQVRRQLEGEELARFDEALTVAREVAPLKEDHNYLLDRRVQSALRELALRVGARLVLRGWISVAEDVMHLQAAEVSDAIVAPTDLRRAITERRKALARQALLKPPLKLGAFEPQEAVAASGPLGGIAASPGRARGQARVVLHPDDFARFQPGDVLVCKATTPSWIPILAIAGAAVAETGTATSHAAVEARELRIPAVVGVQGATTLLTDGEVIEVDGSLGTVTSLGFQREP
jgi:pyruvate,water dikinase